MVININEDSKFGTHFIFSEKRLERYLRKFLRNLVENPEDHPIFAEYQTE